MHALIVSVTQSVDKWRLMSFDGVNILRRRLIPTRLMKKLLF